MISINSKGELENVNKTEGYDSDTQNRRVEFEVKLKNNPTIKCKN